MVMPSNTRGIVTGWIAGRFPGRLGHLYSVDGLTRLYDFMPFALDNGRFPCWAANRRWEEAQYCRLLDRVVDLGGRPMWALVPDSVGDRDGTLREWDAWAPRLQTYGWPLAMAVQDGMTPADVPTESAVVFVGGSTQWKWRTLRDWCDAFERVHVGRVNGNRGLWECDDAGVESCDGTGWMRGDQRQLAGLISYLERSSKGLSNPRGRGLFA